MSGLKYTIEDIAARPHAYGAALGIRVPTFDEFAKNPEKYKTGPLALLECVEAGPNTLRGSIRHILYHINGEQLKSLEAVEQRAKDLGWDLMSMEIKPDLEKVTAGKYDVHVKFCRKGNLEIAR